MLELDLGLETPNEGRTVFVQEEPALEIALPQVFEQPPLTVLQRGKVAHVEALAVKIAHRYLEHPDGALGPDYQELVTEFQPLFAWTVACWDYLLSTEGCRFLSRSGEQRWGARGDYRAFTDKDYSRLVHTLFRNCILEFPRVVETASTGPDTVVPPSLNRWLRARFWSMVLETYRRLDQPADPRQRSLTPYRYLRCAPYQFLNEYHHDLVYTVVKRLPVKVGQAVDAYFLHFYTETASATALDCSMEECLALLRQALVKLLIQDRLVYCLLRQIERY